MKTSAPGAAAGAGSAPRDVPGARGAGGFAGEGTGRRSGREVAAGASAKVTGEPRGKGWPPGWNDCVAVEERKGAGAVGDRDRDGRPGLGRGRCGDAFLGVARGAAREVPWAGEAARVAVWKSWCVASLATSGSSMCAITAVAVSCERRRLSSCGR